MYAAAGTGLKFSSRDLEKGVAITCSVPSNSVLYGCADDYGERSIGCHVRHRFFEPEKEATF